MRTLIIASILSLGIFACTPVQASQNRGDGCKNGDHMVTSGEHAGQCAHTPQADTHPSKHKVAELSDAKAEAPQPMSDGRHSPRHGHDIKEPIGSVASEPAVKVVAVKVEHPFFDVAITTQFRCHLEGGQVVHDKAGEGTGWCHD